MTENQKTPDVVCPLCENSNFAPTPGETDYHDCLVCRLRFLDPRLRLSRSEERSRYDLHQNRDDDPGYLQFLNPVLRAVTDSHPKSARGLDFGCGPNPVLAKTLTKAGHAVAVYDPFFAANEDALLSKFDFVTCTEVAEHFHDPSREFGRLRDLLVPGGSLILLTLLLSDRVDFARWHYRRDPTHVVFYSRATLEWITRHFDFSDLRVSDDRLVILIK